MAVPACRHCSQVAIVFYQNMLALPIVYGFSVPREWYDWLGLFTFVNLDFLDVYHAHCLGSVSSRLHVIALGSLGAVVCILALGALLEVVKHAIGTAKHGGSIRAMQSLRMGMPYALFAVFTLVPGVSRNLFRMWSCKKYLDDVETGASIEFLTMETSVMCGSDEHASILRVALVYLVLW